MAGYQSISIKDAMNNIATNQYLLPAIQRKFVWKISQIEMLFDSILRGYPINSFMLWRITDKNIKHDFKFYQFIKQFVEKFREENPEAPAALLSNDFYAVIDGQQRMTSLLIGLDGYYKEKKANKWWQDTEAKTPMDEKKLYLELTDENPITVDNDKKYNFRFLSNDQLNTDLKNNPQHFWFRVGEVLKFETAADVMRCLYNNDLVNNKFASDTLLELFNKINKEQLINYYVVSDQNQDKVLDIFIRANSGGTPLTFSDLLMSIAAANWTQYDARKEIEEVKRSIFSYGNPNFNVSQDFILKSILVLSDVDVRFRIRNFGKSNITSFESKWEDIKKSLIATFHLLEELNINDSMLRAKNAAIPIAYYIYKKGVSEEIVKTTYDPEDKKRISKWLCMSLLKGIFGGTSDNILRSIRDVTQITDYSVKLSVNDKDSAEKKVGDFIHFLPILAFDGAGMNQISAQEVLDITYAGTSATLLAKRWQTALLVHVDNDTLKRLQANPQVLEALNGLEGFRRLNDTIQTIINKSEKVKKAKTRDENDPISDKEKKEITKEEKEMKSLRKQIQENLLKLASRIPAFMYLTDYRERSLKDVITQIEPELFKKVTGLNVSDFDVLCSIGLFDPEKMNQGIFGFRRYENSSLSYTGIDKHVGEDVGGWDTVLKRDEYNELYAKQQATMVDFVGIIGAQKDERVSVIVEKKKDKTKPDVKHGTREFSKDEVAILEEILNKAKPGTIVEHKTFGNGTIIGLKDRDKKIVVRFAAGEKVFLFPDSFLKGFLTF